MEKKKDGFPNEKAIVIPQENLLKIIHYGKEERRIPQ